jgi:hypothetical protein
MIWKHLGFNRDIFFVEPLRPIDEDIKLFVGRDKEIEKYLVDTLSGSRSLKIVSGEIGTGKTTFVNACQYFSYMGQLPIDFKFEIPHVLPCFEKIQIRESDSLDDFFLQTITAVCQSIVHYCRLNEIEPPEEVKKILSHFLDLAIDAGGAGFSLGLNILGTGGEMSLSTKAKAQNILRNARLHLKTLVGIAIEKFKFKGVFITVNNLDILSKEKLIRFINEARDELFDINGIYWTFIGRKGIGSIIETESERVADYLSGTESYIGPLDFDKANKIVDVRVEAFRQNGSVRCPFTNNTISLIHSLSLKEIRETLKICGEIARRVIMINPSLRIIPQDVAMNVFIQYAHERAKDLDLSDSSAKILKAVFDQRSCRPKDYALFGYQAASGFAQALHGLVKKRLLSVEERGRARIYRMTGMTMFAAITGALGKEIADVAFQSIKSNHLIDPKGDKFNNGQLELKLED